MFFAAAVAEYVCPGLRLDRVADVFVLCDVCSPCACAPPNRTTPEARAELECVSWYFSMAGVVWVPASLTSLSAGAVHETPMDVADWEDWERLDGAPGAPGCLNSTSAR